MVRRGAAAVLSTLLIATHALGGPAEDDARRLFDEGLAQEASDPRAACEKFRRALELIRELGPLEKAKTCDARENKLRAARDKLRELVSRWPTQDAELAALQRELAEMEERIPRLTLTLEPDAPTDLSVRVDGVEVSLPAQALEFEPGEHEILVEAASVPLSRRPVTLAPGDRLALLLPKDVAKTAAPPASSPDGLGGLGIAGIAIGGLGVAGLVGGAVTGALVSAKKSDYDACVGPCTELKQEGDDLLLVNGILFIAGAATTALGGTLLIVDLVGSDTTESALHLGPGRAELLVRF